MGGDGLRTLLVQVKRLLEHLKAKLSQQAGDAVNDGAGGNASVTVDAERADKVESTVEEELDMEPEIDLNDPNLDLNKVSITQLKKAKAKMEEQFSKNQKLPGEMGFQYDVQVDFQFSEGVGFVNCCCLPVCSWYECIAFDIYATVQWDIYIESIVNSVLTSSTFCPISLQSEILAVYC